MSDFIIENGILTKYTGAGGDVVIPDGVEEVGDWVFAWCDTLTTVTIPASVTVIGELAFDGCTALTTVTISGGLQLLGREAFSGCSVLTSITLGGGVQTISEYAFCRCTKLVRIDLPAGTQVIESHAFDSCAALTTISLPATLTELARDAFWLCPNLRRIIAPQALCEGLLHHEATRLAMGYLVAHDSGVFTPAEQDYFDRHIRSHKHALLQLILEDGEAMTGYIARGFVRPEEYERLIHSATDIDSGDAVLALLKGRTAKQQHQAVSISMTESPQLDIETARADWTWETPDTEHLVLTGYKGTSASILLPAVIGKLAVTEIAELAFAPSKENRSDLRQAFLGDKLESVKIPYGITKLGGGVFQGCKALKEVLFSDSVTEIGKVALSGCTGLQTLAIPASVHAIPDGLCFRCTALTSVTIAEGVKEIGDFAFSDCKNLTAITIPASVERIGDFTFGSCPHLTIHAPAGSAAEQYAKKSGIPFEAI